MCEGGGPHAYHESGCLDSCLCLLNSLVRSGESGCENTRDVDLTNSGSDCLGFFFFIYFIGGCDCC